ncbi:MFS transporter [Halosegnis marinus]|uniref:MFS transporter n=1 Tax=Halosegnis marinus TaxID=3034023 RepID=A0ABD5ZLK3_9EURY|nr:MFS transporter [Halosegnis sp. DT85]
MREAPLTEVVGRYYAYMAASTLGFLTPVWVLLLETRGFSFTEIALLDSVFFAALVVSEIPTGYLGDRLGRRNALVLGTLGVAGAAAAFGLAESFVGFLGVYLAWAVATTLRTGNDSAWLYDALDAHGRAASFAAVRGRGLAAFLGVGAVASVAGGYLFTLDPRYPFFATAAVNTVAAGVLLTFPEFDGRDGTRFTVGDAATAVRRLSRPGLRGFVLYLAAFWAVGWSADLFVQPVTTRAGLDAVGLGLLYAGFTAVSAVAVNYADRIASAAGLGRLLGVSPFLLGGVFVAVALAPALAVPAFLTARLLLNVTAPVAEGYLNDRTPSLGRATALSAFSMAVSLATIPVKLVAGPLADRSLFLALGALGAGLLVVAAVLFAWERPVADPPAR